MTIGRLFDFEMTSMLWTIAADAGVWRGRTPGSAR
jgi:hypothetical protein